MCSLCHLFREMLLHVLLVLLLLVLVEHLSTDRAVEHLAIMCNSKSNEEITPSHHNFVSRLQLH